MYGLQCYEKCILCFTFFVIHCLFNKLTNYNSLILTKSFNDSFQ